MVQHGLESYEKAVVLLAYWEGEVNLEVSKRTELLDMQKIDSIYESLSPAEGWSRVRRTFRTTTNLQKILRRQWDMQGKVEEEGEG